MTKIEDGRRVFKMLIGKYFEKKPLRISRRKWVD